MKVNHFSLLGIILIIILSSCSPIYYTPSTQHVPLLSEKGETTIALAGNGIQEEVMASYAITEHLGVTGYLGNLRNDSRTAILNNGKEEKSYELGLGYFTPFAENFVFESYALIGGGSLSSKIKPYNIYGWFSEDVLYTSGGQLDAKIFKLGLQTNVGMKFKYFEAILSSKIFNTSYSDIVGDQTFLNIQQKEFLNKNDSQLRFEPAFTLRAGLENIKLQAQIGRSINLSGNSFLSREYPHYLTIGANIRLNTKNWKKK